MRAVLSKNASVIKGKEWLWKYSRLREVKELWQPDATVGLRPAPVLQGEKWCKEKFLG